MNKIPETIEELKFAYQAKNLPPEEVTRFFIGKDYKGARAFGIYKDEITEKFVVYKNKDDVTRAVRYEGDDEAYAVKQFYIKLEEEIINQKSNQNNNSSDNYKSVRNITQKITIGIYIFAFIIMIIIFVVSIYESFKPKRGYYLYNNDYYYYQNGDWYDYGEDDDWDIVYDVPKTLKENHSDYYKASKYYYLNDGISNFENSSYYEEPTSSSSSDYSSSDYGDTWDSGDSWDSSSTDWSSDW